MGSLLVDNQLLIVRIRGMASDECLIAVSSQGVIFPWNIKGASVLSGPPPTGMKWSNMLLFNRLAKKWNLIINSLNVLALHRFSDSSIFYKICNNPQSGISFIRDHKLNK